MKRILSVLLALFVMLFGFALAAVPLQDGRYVLEPGRYKVGEDIPCGSYDVRFNNLDYISSIRYSTRLTPDGELDMSAYNAYSVLYTSNWNQAIYTVISLYSNGYLDISFSPLIFWPE